MKVLLINSNRFKHPWPVIPFGLCCIAASVEREGHDVEVLDLCFSKTPEDEIQRTVQRYSPDVIGISIRNIDNGVGYNTLFLMPEIKERIVSPCRSIFPGPILVGGPAVGINPVEILRYLNLEFAIPGDGELAFLEFLRRMELGLSVDGMPGLVWVKGDRVISRGTPWRVTNIDDFPLPNPQKYLDITPYRRFNSPIQIQTKRGCALKCTYCTYNHIEGHRYRLRDPNKVADEIERLVEETGITTIEFTDSTFNIPLSHAKSVLKALLEKRLHLDLRTMGLNPGAIDEELVSLMKQVGFREVDLGVEAGCNSMLKSLGKNFDKKDIIKAGRLLRQKEIPTTWYLLLGALGETEETVRETFDTINQVASPWDLINVAVGMRVYNGSPIAEIIKEKYPTLTQDNFFHPITIPPDMTLDIQRLKYLVKMESFDHTNYFMYDEDENTPSLLLMFATSMLRLFAPRQPLWRLFILMRKIQKALGIRWIQKQLYIFRNKSAQDTF